MNIAIYEDLIDNVDTYVSEIIEEGFEDIQVGEDLFKNVCHRGLDELVGFLLIKYSDYCPVLNFVRNSPLGQEEPNFIHTDEMMGDLTAILYLNKNYPSEYGTTLYDEDNNEVLICKAKYNSLFIFPSHVKHSRNSLHNFGNGDDARLVQVCFLKKII
ncbi:MAG: hypothetical protein QNK63_02190 [Flavobacteriales bacterium]